MTEKPPSDENSEFDPEAEAAETQQLIEQEDAEARAEEAQHRKELMNDVRLDKEVEGMESNEQTQDAKRMIDEVQDKKEEDGGDSRE